MIRRLDLVRLTVAAAALLMAVGCTGLIDDTVLPTDLEKDEANARRLWDEKAWPVLELQCAGCHTTMPLIDFLNSNGADLTVDTYAIREKLVTFTPSVVNLETPPSSRLLTKGFHSGPELTPTESSDLLEWVRAEQDARPQPGEEGGAMLLATPAIMPMICPSGTPLPSCPVNTLDLTNLGLPGAAITFTAIQFPSQLYINQLKLVGGSMGAYIEHPLFVSRPPPPPENEPAVEPIADPIDRYFSLKMNLEMATEQVIDGGTASFVGFPLENMLEVHFRVITPYKMELGPGNGGTGTAGGCKDLASFKTNAQAVLQQRCGNCHNGNNANARSAVDMTGMNAADDATILLACNQIKTRVNLTTPAQSGIYLAPAPGNANHPFQLNAADHAAFMNNLGIWITAEQAAP
ncbi:MAG: hypothetical protein ACKV2T_19700 [Kofleriaceae bacterium]